MIDFSLSDEEQMMRDTVRAFMEKEVIPLEPQVLRNEREHRPGLSPEQAQDLQQKAKAAGFWGIGTPEEYGGVDLGPVMRSIIAMETGRSFVPFKLGGTADNILYGANEEQKQKYLIPTINGERHSCFAITEPGAGSDARNIKTRAVRDGDDWIINGRKIWITRAEDADFTILMAVTDVEKGARGGITAFLVDKGTPGFNVLRRIPMLGGQYTYEVALEDCRVEGWKMLGQEGQGFAPMQTRLGTRRIQMAAWSIGMAQRAMEMVIEYAPQRKTFGMPLSERQAIQFWIAEAATKIHAARLMTYDCAWKLDQGRDVRSEISMIKWYATEMAYETLDRAMQAFGAMGMTKELPLQLMQAKLRTMRIYDGPTEVHKWVVARNLLGTRR